MIKYVKEWELSFILEDQNNVCVLNLAGANLKNVAVLGTIPRTTEWSNKTEDVNHYLTDM